tara:strand:+ start:45 stop:803 length:759 start_codon:yes stop_codon:yes gene_type:complete
MPPRTLSSREHSAATRKAWRRGISEELEGVIDVAADEAFGSIMDSVPSGSSDKAFWELLFGDKIAEHVDKAMATKPFLSEVEDEQDIRVPRDEDRKRVFDAMRAAVLEAATTHVADCAYEDICKRLLGYDDADEEPSHASTVVLASDASRQAMMEAHKTSITDLIMRHAVEDVDDDDDDDDDDELDDVQPEPDSEGEEGEEEEESEEEAADEDEEGEEGEVRDADEVRDDLAELKELDGDADPPPPKRKRGE